jgi:threonine dehydrogenase-like Zn-dependent dehydrogenase
MLRPELCPTCKIGNVNVDDLYITPRPVSCDGCGSDFLLYPLNQCAVLLPISKIIEAIGKNI